MTPSPARVVLAHLNRTATVSFEDRVLKVLRKTDWARDNALDVVTDYAGELASKGMSGRQISSMIRGDDPGIEFLDEVGEVFLDEIADILGHADVQYEQGEAEESRPGVFEIDVRIADPTEDDEEVVKALTDAGARYVSVKGNLVRATFEVDLGVTSLLEPHAIDDRIDEVVESGL